MSWQITADVIADLARGAAVLGTGGGGDPYIGRLLAEQAIETHGPVTAVPLSELPEDALVVTVAMMGAPTVMVEKLPSFLEVTRSVRQLEKQLDRPITHIACAEVGGVNSTIPIAAAAALDLPLLDADGMGRAFPELQMVLPTLYGVGAAPLSLADDKGNACVLDTVTNLWAERIARVACVEMGCSVMVTGFDMGGADAARSLVADSLTTCIRIGSAIVEARKAKRDPVAEAVGVLGGREIFDGKVTDVRRTTTAGFARGAARIEGDGVLELLFQNENLVALRDGRPLVTTPDLIIAMERDSGEPVTTEGLRYGQRVRIVAAPADERWHSEGGLALAGPRYFGYDHPSIRFDGRSERP